VTILVLKGESKNNVLREFSDLITSGFNQFNKSAKSIDLLTPEGIADLNELINSGKVEGILSFNGILGNLIPEDFKIPFVSWFVDAPHYHFKKFNHLEKSAILYFHQNTIMIF